MAETPEYVGYIAMSLDGFIADTDGSISWLDPFNEALTADGGDGGYGEFIAPVDAVLMGRTTYDQIMGWGWPYEDRPCYLLTRNNSATCENIAASGNIDTLHRAITAAGHKRVWIVGGGQTQRAAMDAGLFDSMQVFVMPTLLGKGLPCFASGPQHTLTLTSSEQLPGGIMHINYTFKD